MKVRKVSEGRVLARTLAKELSDSDFRKVCGEGTSYAGTGGCDAQGRGADVNAVDCVDGSDTFRC